MLDAFIQLIVFIIEAIVIVISILIIVSGIFAITAKGKEKPKIVIRKLNKLYKEIADTINNAILEKTERRKLKKAERKTRKLAKKHKNRMFVINFQGDIRASAVSSLREEITAILTVADPKEDEVVVRLESTGGMVHSYGLAASELRRIKDKEIPLTIIVDKVAASGGYLMACVADRILAAPFAIIGSIGVLAQLPNFNRLLKKHNIDFEQITAGKYKRTLTVFGENTDENRQKFQQEINDIHKLFKEFIEQNRPKVDIEKVSTGEFWFGTRAIDLNLIDELKTSDDYLLQASESHDLYEITYKKKKKRIEKMFFASQKAFKKILSAWQQHQTEENLFL